MLNSAAFERPSHSETPACDSNAWTSRQTTCIERTSKQKSNSPPVLNTSKTEMFCRCSHWTHARWREALRGARAGRRNDRERQGRGKRLAGETCDAGGFAKSETEIAGRRDSRRRELEE